MTRSKRRTEEQPQFFLQRILPFWGTLQYLDGNLWRRVVNSQMVGRICRDWLIAKVLQLRWEIRPRDPSQSKQYGEEIDRWTEIFLKGEGEGYDVMLDLLLQDVLDLPFGGMLEQVWEGNEVVELVNVDGATLRPHYDPEHPVIQIVPHSPHIPIVLQKKEIERFYLSPRGWIERKGWGMAPPERIYLGLELLTRGDRYYANLLLDTPPAGILDLIDMSQGSAEEWVMGYRELLIGPDALKIPVLYEHDKPAVFIPFNRSPQELVYNETTLRYAGLVCAGYGMTLSDIGLLSMQKSLAGEIREERRSRRMGFGLLVAKIKYGFERILPPYLEWIFVQDDEESMIALGRSRLTNARALGEYVNARILSAQEAREQTVADGLITIYLPPKSPEELGLEEEGEPDSSGRGPQEAHLIGKPTPPSEGGHGEIKPDSGRQGPTG